MSKFRRKNCVVDAVLWTGGEDQLGEPEWLVEAIKNEIVQIFYKGTPHVILYVKYDEYESYTYPGNYLVLEESGIRIWSKDKFEESFEKI